MDFSIGKIVKSKCGIFKESSFRTTWPEQGIDLTIIVNFAI